MVKLKASTLIEVLIAMVIIMIVFTLGIQIFNNVLYSSPAAKKIQVHQQLDVLAKTVQETGAVEQEELMIDSVQYVFKVDSSGIQGLKKLEITADQQGQRLGSTRVLYKYKDNEE